MFYAENNYDASFVTFLTIVHVPFQCPAPDRDNASARLLTGTSVDNRIDFKVLLLVCRALLDQAPEYMRDMLQERTTVRILRSTVSSQLAVPRSGLKGFGDRAVSVAAPRPWYALSGSITECKSSGAFKNVLRHICSNLPLTR